MPNSWTQGLNPEQKKAVEHTHGPLLILAGAGSGKTTVLVSRTGRLIDEGLAQPREICVLTFTNKAAGELKERVARKLGEPGKGVWAGTFHSLGLLILRQFHEEAGLPKYFGILDASDAQAMAKELLKNFKYAEKMDFDVAKVLSIMGEWRTRHKTQGHVDNHYEVAAEWLLPKYLGRMRRLGVLDFDELLLRPLELMENNPTIRERIQKAFKFVMVDEFQDTNRTQMDLVNILVEKHRNIGVVGDDDQSIYGWRGACIENILTFPQQFRDCKVIKLERNYRSTPNILKLANAIISKNEKRHGKQLKSDPSATAGDIPEIFVFENEDEEVERVVGDIQVQVQKGSAFKEFAILYRSNGQGAIFEAECKRQRIPHKVSGGTGFFDRRETKDVLAFLRCALRPNEVAFRRILNVPHRGVGDTTVEQIENWARQHKQSFFLATKNWRGVGVHEQAGVGIEHLLNGLKKLSQLFTGGEVLRWLEEMGYKEHLLKSSKDALQGNQRWGFVEIFANVLDKFVSRGGANRKTILEFIDSMELRDEQEDEEENKNAVQLLTLHACKGLEFPYVYLVGVEEDLLPHKTLGGEISEERRLFYVGVTRAQKHLILTRAKARKKYGKLTPSTPSRFLLDLPEGLWKEHSLGWRPVSQDERKNMLQALFQKIDANSSK